MNNVSDKSHVMMSDAIRDSIQDVDVTQFKSNYILSTVLVDTGDSIEPIVGGVVDYIMADKECELCIKVLLEDAFDISGAWQRIKIKNFLLELGDQVLNFPGPYAIKALSVRDIDSSRQTCALSMKLCVE